MDSGWLRLWVAVPLSFRDLDTWPPENYQLVAC